MRKKQKGIGRKVSTTLSLIGLVLLGGCDSTRETLGMAKHGPDAFASEPLKAHLDVPPSYGVLPAPQDGTGKETDPFPPAACFFCTSSDSWKRGFVENNQPVF